MHPSGDRLERFDSDAKFSKFFGNDIYFVVSGGYLSQIWLPWQPNAKIIEICKI